VVKAEDGVSMVEYFVLHEADSDVLLWELAARWTENGTPEERTNAVPRLRDAVLALAARSFVEVHDLPARPPEGHGPPMIGPRLEDALSGTQNWLWRDDGLRPLTVSLTGAGVPYL
jgi:hypothetical protein